MGFVVFIMTKGQLDGSAVDQGEGLSGFLGTVLESAWWLWPRGFQGPCRQPSISSPPRRVKLGNHNEGEKRESKPGEGKKKLLVSDTETPHDCRFAFVRLEVLFVKHSLRRAVVAFGGFPPLSSTPVCLCPCPGALHGWTRRFLPWWVSGGCPLSLWRSPSSSFPPSSVYAQGEASGRARVSTPLLPNPLSAGERVSKAEATAGPGLEGR